MILAFQISDLITVPFGWLLGQLYNLTSNYGVAMILFALIVQTVLLPIRAKSKKSMMKMSRLQPRIQELQRKYADDQQKQNEAIQALQKEEGASMGCGGCLWSFVPLLILIPLFQVIREPIVYILGETPEMAEKIISTIKGLDPDLFSGNVYYAQVSAAQAISKYASELKSVLPELSETTLAGINFDFLGINLGAIPNWKFWAWDAFSWANIGAFLVPVISAGSQVLQLWIGQKSNDSVITDENGLQDAETAKQSKSAQSSKIMMWMMPLMSLYIGFVMPVALCLYWVAQNLLSMVQEVIAGKLLKKDYEAARIAAEERARQEKEDEKRRKEEARLERARRAEEEKKGKKNKTVKPEEKEESINKEDSKVGIRAYARGRSYDPNRFGGVTPYFDPDQVVAEAPKKKSTKEKLSNEKKDNDDKESV